MRSRRENAALKRKRGRRRALLIAGALLLVLALIGTTAWALLRRTGYEEYEFDTDAIAGRIQTMTQEEIQAELDRVVEEGMFNISIASSIVFDSPQAEGLARIENVQANRYLMQVDIVLDDTEETVYSSGLIRPGYSIANIQLSKALEPGIYPAKAIFSAITQEEKQRFGTAAAAITLYILDGDTQTEAEQ